MGEGLVVRGPLHERRDLLPRPRPGQPGGDVPAGRAGRGGHGVRDLGEPFLVVLDEVRDAAGQLAEPVLVRGEHLLHVEGVERAQRVEVVGERVRRGLRVHRHVGGDPRQHVVPGEQKPALRVGEAQVARGVPGGPHRAQVPAGQADPLVVLDEPVRHGHGHEAADHHRGLGELLGGHLRHAAPDEEVELLLGELLHRVLLVPVVDEPRVGRVEADPRPGGLPDPPGEAVVVGVHVGDEHGLDVGDRVAGGPQPGLERLVGLLGVPAGVDDGHAVGELQRVDQDVPERVDRDRHRYRPQPGPHPLDLGQRTGDPRLVLPGARGRHGVPGAAPGALPGVLGVLDHAPRLSPLSSENDSLLEQNVVLLRARVIVGPEPGSGENRRGNIGIPPAIGWPDDRPDSRGRRGHRAATRLRRARRLRVRPGQRPFGRPIPRLARRGRGARRPARRPPAGGVAGRVPVVRREAEPDQALGRRAHPAEAAPRDQPRRRRLQRGLGTALPPDRRRGSAPLPGAGAAGAGGRGRALGGRARRARNRGGNLA